VGGAVAILLAGVFARAGVDLSPEEASALTVVMAAAGGFLTPAA
jgi:hypothetical protein